MIRKVLSRFRRRLGISRAALSWVRHGSTLNSFTIQEELQAYIEKLQPKLFAHYENISPIKRLEFQTVIDHLGISLEGRSILDIGPGFGDSLDISHERGARSVHFVDIDPFFFTYNRLKPFAEGHRLDHIQELNKVDAEPFDVVWICGAPTADLFMTGKYPITLEEWLSHLDGLAAPSSHTVMCPFWLHDGGRRHVEDVAQSAFSTTLHKHGYEILPPLPNTHCSGTTAPIWFCRRKG